MNSFPLRSSAVIKGGINDSLKAPLTKRPSEVGYWMRCHEVVGVWDKKTYRLLNVNHKFLNFWGKTIWGKSET